MGRVVHQIVDEYVNIERDKAAKTLSMLNDNLDLKMKPEKIGQYPAYIRQLQDIAAKVKPVNLTFSFDEVEKRVHAHYEQLLIDHSNREVAINTKYEAMLDKAESDIIEEAKRHNRGVIDAFDEANQVYIDLENKRLELEKYQDDVVELCASYGITTADVRINNSSFTIEELDSIYDQYINYMRKARNRKNFVGAFRDKVGDNPAIEGVVLLALGICAFTFVLDLVAIGFFASIVLSQMKAKTKMKSYTILLGLIYNIHPLDMGFKNEFDKSKLVSEEVNEEEAEELQPIAEQWQAELDALDAVDPQDGYELELEDLIRTRQNIEVRFEENIKVFKANKDKVESRISTMLAEAQMAYEKLRAEFKALGEAIGKQPYFNTNFKLGVHDEVIEEVYDMGLQNIIIHPNSNTVLQRQFLQIMLANALCNVKPGALTVYIYDPNNFGQDLVGFYKDDLQNLLIFENDNLENILKDLKKFTEENMKTQRGMNINEFNKWADSQGITTKEYKLLIVLSQPKKLEEDEALSKFMTYSANFGVMVWLLSSKTVPNAKIFKTPFEGVRYPYRAGNDFCDKVSNTLVTAIKNSKTAGLPWKEFTKVAIPEKDIWTYHADQFLDLDPGFWDGDPTQYKGYTVGNEGDVHALAVGGTGAGKSVFLNQLIANACLKYSPIELELWMVDFKGSEFVFYLPTMDHPRVLPHIRACLCTSDGDYAGSLFKALRAEAERRYKYLMKCGFKNMKEYNQRIRQGVMYEMNDPENPGEKLVKLISDPNKVTPNLRKLTDRDVLSRILFVCDEFQVIFEKAEDKIKDQIMKDITYIAKVARACGVHMLFTSQSMKGTVKADTLQQFTLRFALRCEPEVSKDIMGTTYASDIKAKFGWLYVKSQGDKSKEAQKKYRTPYASDEELRNNINMLADRAAAEGMPKRDLISYEETTKHNLSEVDTFYKKHESRMPSGTFILGERMTYSSNKAPLNTILGAKNNTHIMSAFQDTTDLVNFFKTMMRNISLQKEPSSVFINSQIADLHYLCELDKCIEDEQYQSLSNEKIPVTSLIKLFQSIYDSRVKNAKKDEPVYIILIGWDKAQGFGIDSDYNAVTTFTNLLQMCGEYNMHFIFICTNGKPIKENIVTACSTIIAGRCNEDTSYKFFNSKQASKIDDSLANGYMYVNMFGEIARCKIYQSKLEREVIKNEFVTK